MQIVGNRQIAGVTLLKNYHEFNILFIRKPDYLWLQLIYLYEVLVYVSIFTHLAQNIYMFIVY